MALLLQSQNTVKEPLFVRGVTAPSSNSKRDTSAKAQSNESERVSASKKLMDTVPFAGRIVTNKGTYLSVPLPHKNLPHSVESSEVFFEAAENMIKKIDLIVEQRNALRLQTGQKPFKIPKVRSFMRGSTITDPDSLTNEVLKRATYEEIGEVSHTKRLINKIATFHENARQQLKRDLTEPLITMKEYNMYKRNLRLEKEILRQRTAFVWKMQRRIIGHRMEPVFVPKLTKRANPPPINQKTSTMFVKSTDVHSVFPGAKVGRHFLTNSLKNAKVNPVSELLQKNLMHSKMMQDVWDEYTKQNKISDRLPKQDLESLIKNAHDKFDDYFIARKDVAGETLKHVTFMLKGQEKLSKPQLNLLQEQALLDPQVYSILTAGKKEESMTKLELYNKTNKLKQDDLNTDTFAIMLDRLEKDKANIDDGISALDKDAGDAVDISAEIRDEAIRKKDETSTVPREGTTDSFITGTDVFSPEKDTLSSGQDTSSTSEVLRQKDYMPTGATPGVHPSLSKSGVSVPGVVASDKDMPTGVAEDVTDALKTVSTKDHSSTPVALSSKQELIASMKVFLSTSAKDLLASSTGNLPSTSTKDHNEDISLKSRRSLPTMCTKDPDMLSVGDLRAHPQSDTSLRPRPKKRLSIEDVITIQSSSLSISYVSATLSTEDLHPQSTDELPGKQDSCTEGVTSSEKSTDGALADDGALPNKSDDESSSVSKANFSFMDREEEKSESLEPTMTDGPMVAEEKPSKGVKKKSFGNIDQKLPLDAAVAAPVAVSQGLSQEKTRFPDGKNEEAMDIGFSQGLAQKKTRFPDGKEEAMDIGLSQGLAQKKTRFPNGKEEAMDIGLTKKKSDRSSGIADYKPLTTIAKPPEPVQKPVAQIATSSILPVTIVDEKPKKATGTRTTLTTGKKRGKKVTNKDKLEKDKVDVELIKGLQLPKYEEYDPRKKPFHNPIEIRDKLSERRAQLHMIIMDMNNKNTNEEERLFRQEVVFLLQTEHELSAQLEKFDDEQIDDTLTIIKKVFHLDIGETPSQKKEALIKQKQTKEKKTVIEEKEEEEEEYQGVPGKEFENLFRDAVVKMKTEGTDNLINVVKRILSFFKGNEDCKWSKISKKLKNMPGGPDDESDQGEDIAAHMETEVSDNRKTLMSAKLELEMLRLEQRLTRPFEFSYYVCWPDDSKSQKKPNKKKK